MKSSIQIRKLNVYFKKLLLRSASFLNLFLIPLARYRNNFLALNNDRLIAIYDLRENALSFNFLQFIVDCDVYRIDNNLAKIDLYIICN